MFKIRSLTTINACNNLYLSSGKYREIDVLKTIGYPHRIIQKKFS